MELRRHLGDVLRQLALRKECQILEGHLRSDHVHMLVSIPPKYAVSDIVGYIKGKSAIYIARNFGERALIVVSAIARQILPQSTQRTQRISVKTKVSSVLSVSSVAKMAQTMIDAGERKRNFTGQSFWARGFFVSTVGRDEETVRKYIQKQEEEDRRLDQLNLFEE